MLTKKIKLFIAHLLITTGCLSAVSAASVSLSLGTSSSSLPSNQRMTVPVKVVLSGQAILEKIRARRPSVNIALVLDKSGSMSGDKMFKAKEAAILAVNMLGPNDIVSIITYDNNVEVIVPATKVREKEYILRKIRQIVPGGSTALFAGVSKGAGEIKKFFERNQVNRVLLISDGLANVGPSKPRQLGSLGGSLGREGISVSSVGLGLGYNEDLMVQLSGNSDGNHHFAESAWDLERIFKSELGDVLSVVAQNIEIRIECHDSVRPVRVLGRDAQIYGNTVVTNLNHIYGGQEKYVLLEVDIPAQSSGRQFGIANVDVSFSDLLSEKKHRLRKTLDVSFTDALDEVKESLDKDTLVKYEQQKSNVASEKALELRDAGRKDEAKKVLKRSAQDLRQKAALYSSPQLREQAIQYESDAEEIVQEGSSWVKQRKRLKVDQYKLKKQER